MIILFFSFCLLLTPIPIELFKKKIKHKNPISGLFAEKVISVIKSNFHAISVFNISLKRIVFCFHCAVKILWLAFTRFLLKGSVREKLKGFIQIIRKLQYTTQIVKKSVQFLTNHSNITTYSHRFFSAHS